MHWFYGVGCLVILAGFLLYDYYYSDRPRVLKPKKLKEDKDPMCLKDVLWTGKPEREYYEEKGKALVAERHFYKHTETNAIYIIETKCDELIGLLGPISIDEMDDRLLNVDGDYSCSSHHKDWLKANSDKLVIISLCNR